MNNSTGEQPAGLVSAIPDLVFPNLSWHEEDYAHLEAQLSLYTDFIVMTKYNQGQAAERFVVDPDDVAAALGGLTINSGLLPDGCLFWHKKDGAEGVGLYLPPQVRLVTVRDEPTAWRVPLPGLVFAGRGYQYQVWAAPERPTDSKYPLLMAPTPNVSPHGVCQGNAPFPQAGPATIWQAVDAFFSSKFNRDLSNQKSRKYPQGVLELWRELHEAGAEQYPGEDLLGTNLTLGGLIHAL